MELFDRFLALLAELPELLSLLLCPALLVAAALLLTLLKKKGAYLPCALALGAVGYLLVYSRDERLAPAYLALFVVLAALLRLLFLIPLGSKSRNANELYEKFRVPLDEAPFPEEPKDGKEVFDAEECGLRLSHARSLIEALQKSELSAADRLELDALSHLIEGYGDRALTAEEMRALNDCLATVLKMTAKYQL